MKESEVVQMRWFVELVAEIEEALNEMSKRTETQMPPLEDEKRELENQVKGWSQSLANPNLPINLRQHIEPQCDAALQRIADIDIAIDGRLAESRSLHTVADPSQVAERLSRLDKVLAGNNPPMGNIELAHHIDRIDCHADGKVVVRTCKLGALTEAVELFKQVGGSSNGQSEQVKGRPNSVVPRRLTRRRVETGEAPTDELKARAIWATDPNRFAYLDERWFKEHMFHVPEPTFWAKEHAAEVAASRKLGATEQMLSDQFGVSLPTIRKSLRIARKSDPELLLLPRRMPRARWHEDHALEVAAKKAGGMSTEALAQFYDKSDTTIRHACKHAELLAAQANAPAPSTNPAPDPNDDDR